MIKIFWASSILTLYLFFVGNAGAFTGAISSSTPMPLPTSNINFNTHLDTSSTGKKLQPWQPKPKEEVVLDRGALSKNKPSPELTAKVVDPAHVHKLEELNVFAFKIMEGDEYIKYIKIILTLTEIDYIFPGRLFGIIPFKAVTRTFVDSKHNVRVQSPWYRPILAKSADFNAKEADDALKSESATMSALPDDFSRQALQFEVLTRLMKNTREQTGKK